MKNKQNKSIQAFMLLIVIFLVMGICSNDVIDRNNFDAEDIGDMSFCTSISILLPDALYAVPDDHTFIEKKRESSIYRIRDPNIQLDTLS